MATSVSVIENGEFRTSSARDRVALAGRILLALIFVMSGAGKLADPVTTMAYMRATGLPLVPAGMALAVIVELGGGLALMLGYRARFAAIVLALFAVVTALIFHANFADQNQMIHFMKNVAIAGGLLEVAAFGGGPVGLDARLERGRRP